MCMSLKLVTLRNSYNTAHVETPYTSKYRWVLVQLNQHERIHIKLRDEAIIKYSLWEIIFTVKNGSIQNHTWTSKPNFEENARI